MLFCARPLAGPPEGKAGSMFALDLLASVERIRAFSTEKLIRQTCVIKSQPADLLASFNRFPGSVFSGSSCR